MSEKATDKMIWLQLQYLGFYFFTAAQNLFLIFHSQGNMSFWTSYPKSHAYSQQDHQTTNKILSFSNI